MAQLREGRRENSVVVMPDHFGQDPRLALWYKCGFQMAAEGYSPSATWLQHVAKDTSGWEAYREGYNVGSSHQGSALVSGGRWSR